jgi:CubicO group peptidase (beta-lactamase class C family)
MSFRRPLKRELLTLTFLSILFLASNIVVAQDVQGMREAMNKFVAEKNFMGSVLVTKDHVPVFSEGYGYANLEWERPNTSTTKFRIGSITKQITAAAILQLEEAGKLNTGDQIGNYLSQMPDSWQDITILHLLTHASGIPNLDTLQNFPEINRYPISPREAIQLIADEPLLFKPGSDRSYSNMGYTLLGYIVEQLTDQPYADYVEQHIFAPLEMGDSGYDSSAEVIKNRAQGYERNSENIFLNSASMDTSIPYAAGGLYSTTEDLARWNTALYGGELISKESLEKMLRPYGELPPLPGFTGFGTFINESPYGTRYSNGGVIRGFVSSINYFPESRISVIVLSNVFDFDSLAIGSTLSELAHSE